MCVCGGGGVGKQETLSQAKYRDQDGVWTPLHKQGHGGNKINVTNLATDVNK